MRILIYGIGNPGRQDDGLGTLLVEEIQHAAIPGASIPGIHHEFSFDANYQLNIEDAEAISRHDIVVFADASLGGGADGCAPGAADNAGAAEDADAADTAAGGNTRSPDDSPFRLYAIGPEPTASFSTHSVSPGGIVALCYELYDARPKAYMLAIRGYEWEVNEPLSERAEANLNAAVQFLTEALGQPGGLSLLGERT